MIDDQIDPATIAVCEGKPLLARWSYTSNSSDDIDHPVYSWGQLMLRSDGVLFERKFLGPGEYDSWREARGDGPFTVDDVERMYDRPADSKTHIVRIVLPPVGPVTDPESLPAEYHSDIDGDRYIIIDVEEGDLSGWSLEVGQDEVWRRQTGFGGWTPERNDSTSRREFDREHAWYRSGNGSPWGHLCYSGDRTEYPWSALVDHGERIIRWIGPNGATREPKTPVSRVTERMSPDSSSHVDLSWRPVTYFWPPGLEKQLLATVKGAARRAAVQRLIDEGRLLEIPDFLATAGLSDDERTAIGRIHPHFIGGEYPPDQDEGEIEIARIEINSTTGDITSVYAHQDASTIRYRVVDEYGGETLRGETECASTQPLTLGELGEFFLGAWPFDEVLESNFGTDTARMLEFFDGVSQFYPDFDNLLRERVIEAHLESHHDEETADSDMIVSGQRRMYYYADGDQELIRVDTTAEPATSAFYDAPAHRYLGTKIGWIESVSGYNLPSEAINSGDYSPVTEQEALRVMAVIDAHRAEMDTRQADLPPPEAGDEATGHRFAIVPAGSVDSLDQANDLIHAMGADSDGEPSNDIRELLDELAQSVAGSFFITRPADRRGVIIATHRPEDGLLRFLLLSTMVRGLTVYDIELFRLYDPRGRVDVDVSLPGDVTLPYLTPALLRDLVLRPTWPEPDDPYFIVTRGDHKFIQTYRDEDGKYQLEHRDGASDAHFAFRTPDTGLVADVMWAWATQDPRWRTAVPWSRMEFEDEDDDEALSEPEIRTIHVDPNSDRELTFVDTNGEPFLTYHAGNAENETDSEGRLIPTGWVLHIEHDEPLVTEVKGFDSVEEAVAKANKYLGIPLPETGSPPGRHVSLQNEEREDGSWLNLDASLGRDGSLRISGQDLGPVTKAISPDGEYEYFYTIAAEDVPALVVALGGQPGADVIDLLEQRWSGDDAYNLGATIRSSGVKYQFSSYP